MSLGWKLGPLASVAAGGALAAVSVELAESVALATLVSVETEAAAESVALATLVSVESVAAAESVAVALLVSVDDTSVAVAVELAAESVALATEESVATSVEVALVAEDVSVLFPVLVSVPLRLGSEVSVQVQVEISGVDPNGQVPEAPNGTIGVLGEPKSPGATPATWELTIPFNSGLIGAFVQYGVDGMTPSILTAFLGCRRYAIACLIKASLLVTPGVLANVIIESAMSCWSQTSASTNRALTPPMPARNTHGSSAANISPPLARQRSCHF